jgi:hypothetical protein
MESMTIHCWQFIVPSFVTCPNRNSWDPVMSIRPAQETARAMADEAASGFEDAEERVSWDGKWRTWWEHGESIVFLSPMFSDHVS